MLLFFNEFMSSLFFFFLGMDRSQQNKQDDLAKTGLLFLAGHPVCSVGFNPYPCISCDKAIVTGLFLYLCGAIGFLLWCKSSNVLNTIYNAC